MSSKYFIHDYNYYYDFGLHETQQLKMYDIPKNMILFMNLPSILSYLSNKEFLGFNSWLIDFLIMLDASIFGQNSTKLPLSRIHYNV
jgi:hypothetical protein